MGVVRASGLALLAARVEEELAGLDLAPRFPILFQHLSPLGNARGVIQQAFVDAAHLFHRQVSIGNALQHAVPLDGGQRADGAQQVRVGDDGCLASRPLVSQNRPSIFERGVQRGVRAAANNAPS